LSTQKFFIEELPNGLTLLGEPIEGVNSAAFSCFVPVGAAHDSENHLGITNLLTEMLQKGSGEYSAKEFSDECEKIGLQKGYASGMEASNFSGTLLSENLEKGLRLFKKMLLEPRFPEEELDSVKSLALQDLAAIEDQPSSKVMEILSSEFYQGPFSRSSLGTASGINTVSIKSIKEHYEEYFGARGAILSVAGKFSWDSFKKVAKELFQDWQGGQERIKVPPFLKKGKNVFHQKEAAQLQIALAYPSVGIEDQNYYTAKVGVNVLSGGMSGRLFVEVREKRGLVYSVSASHSAARERSAIIASAGTTPENGEETLQVMVEQLQSLEQGVSVEELERAKVDLKTRVIMQSESSSGRASAIASDWWNLKRIRPLQEIKDGIETVTEESIVTNAKAYPVSPVTLVTLGVKKLSL
jgi:predicted Zn-dependent peptidase